MSVTLDSSLGSLDWLTERNKAEAIRAAAQAISGEKDESDIKPGKIQKSRDSDLENHPELPQTSQPSSSHSDGFSSNNEAAINIAGPCGPTTSGGITYQPDGKPNLSYAELIKRAISESPIRRMTLNEIYKWITDKFPYYRDQEGTSWKNSIRHNLSLNKQFQKIQRERGDPGKGSYWTIEDAVHDQWSRSRKPRNISENERSQSVLTGQSGRSSNANGPRVNPVIQAIFGKPQNTVQPSPTLESGGINTSGAGQVPVSWSEQDPFVPPTINVSGDPYSTSWSSQGSSLPSNFRPFADFDNSMGSVESQLSESFRNLYQEALKRSFNSSLGMNNSGSNPSCSQGPSNSGTFLPGLPPHPNPAQMDEESKAILFRAFPNLVGPEAPFNPLPGAPMDQSTGSFVPPFAIQEQAVDWLRQQASAFQQAQQQQLQHQSQPGQQVPNPSVSLAHSSTAPQGSEMMQSIDMQQFQSMMGNMQNRDINEWLSQCNPDNLSLSWRDFLSRSIGGSGGLQASLNPGAMQVETDANAATPPACYGMGANENPQLNPMVSSINEETHQHSSPLPLLSLNQEHSPQPPGPSGVIPASIASQNDPVLSVQRRESPEDIMMSTVPTNREESDNESDFDWEELINRN